MIETNIRTLASMICIQKLFLYWKYPKYFSIGDKSSKNFVPIFMKCLEMTALFCESVFPDRE
jgi:hypothetical protein